MDLLLNSAVVWDILDIFIPVTVFCDICATSTGSAFCAKILHGKLLNYFEDKMVRAVLGLYSNLRSLSNKGN